MSVTAAPAWMDLNADETPGDVVLPVEVRVKQGMALLDEKHGLEWVHKINVGTLSLSSNCRCVLGQLYDGEYRRGASRLGIRSAGPGGAAAEFGFQARCEPGTPYGDNADYSALTTAWKHAILARRLELAQAPC